MFIEDDSNAFDYPAKIRTLAKSLPFVAGCALLTIGTVGDIFIDLSWLSAFGLLFAAVHLGALWLLVYDAMFASTSHTKILTAMSMLKFSTVVVIVGICIIFGLLGLATLFDIMPGMVTLLLLGLCIGIPYVIIRYYCLALLNVLSAIKQRIETEQYVELEGLESFVVFSYISVAIAIITALANLIGLQPLTAPNTTIYFSFDYYGDIIFPLDNATTYYAVADAYTSAWNIVFVLASSVGAVLCIQTLKKFD